MAFATPSRNRNRASEEVPRILEQNSVIANLTPTSNYPPEQHWLDSASKANAAIDFNDRNARVEAYFELGISVDIDNFGCYAMLNEHRVRLFAQMAALPRVKHDPRALIRNASSRVHRPLFLTHIRRLDNSRESHNVAFVQRA
jgi:hypothetical protein